jgi:hypothetical protein
MGWTIQVPFWPSRGVPAQARMTAGVSWSISTSQPGVATKRCTTLRSERW